MVGPQRVGGPNPEKVRAPRVGPRRVGPRRVGARTVGAQNFALFFPLPPQFFILFSLSFVLFRGILVVFEASGRSNVHVWALGLSCASPGGPTRGPEHTHHTHTHNKQAKTNNTKHFPTPKPTTTTHKKKGLAKNGLAKIGLAKIGKPLTTNL